MTSSFYVNVSVGIQDRNVFQVPAECVKAATAAAIHGDHESSEDAVYQSPPENVE